MISHVFLGTDRLERAEAFYAPIMQALGWRIRFSDHAAGRVGWEPAPGARPLFVVGRPFDGLPAAPGNGNMAALLARDRPTVDQVHALALAAGAADEGAPGLRPQYHPNYYGAYFRDPEGHKICICCHDAATN